jgi:hypothetical protein
MGRELVAFAGGRRLGRGEWANNGWNGGGLRLIQRPNTRDFLGIESIDTRKI